MALTTSFSSVVPMGLDLDTDTSWSTNTAGSYSLPLLIHEGIWQLLARSWVDAYWSAVKFWQCLYSFLHEVILVYNYTFCKQAI